MVKLNKIVEKKISSFGRRIFSSVSHFLPIRDFRVHTNERDLIES